MRRGKRSTSARTIVLAAFVAVVVPIALMLASCDAPLNLINAIEIEIMKAHNMFLEVTATTPGMEDLDVNPGTEIVIRFDRALDETTIDGNVDVTNLAGATQVNSDWVFRYDQQTYTLTLSPFPWFASNSSYTVLLGAGLRGADGSGLLEPISWSFATNDETTFIFEFGEGTRLLYANAQLEIDRGNTTVPITYTVTDTDSVEYFVTTSESEAYAPPGGAVWTPVAGASGTTEVDFPNAGTNVCYMRIRQAGLIIDVIRSASIFVDRIPPDVDLGGPAYANSAYSVSPVSVSDPGVGSGIDAGSYSWSADVFTVLPTTGTSTVVTGAGDATGTVSLDVSDLAGNVGTGNLAFHWDLTPPTVTSLVISDILSTSTDAVRRAADGAVSFTATETDGRQLAGWEWRSEAGPTYTAGGSLTGTSQGVAGAAVQLLDQAGNRTIDVRAYDAAGNYSTVATDDVELWVKLWLFDPLIYVDHDGDDVGNGEIYWHFYSPDFVYAGFHWQTYEEGCSYFFLPWDNSVVNVDNVYLSYDLTPDEWFYRDSRTYGDSTWEAYGYGPDGGQVLFAGYLADTDSYEDYPDMFTRSGYLSTSFAVPADEAEHRTVDPLVIEPAPTGTQCDGTIEFSYQVVNRP